MLLRFQYNFFVHDFYVVVQMTMLPLEFMDKNYIQRNQCLGCYTCWYCASIYLQHAVVIDEYKKFRLCQRRKMAKACIYTLCYTTWNCKVE